VVNQLELFVIVAIWAVDLVSRQTADVRLRRAVRERNGLVDGKVTRLAASVTDCRLITSTPGVTHMASIGCSMFNITQELAYDTNKIT